MNKTLERYIFPHKLYMTLQNWQLKLHFNNPFIYLIAVLVI